MSSINNHFIFMGKTFELLNFRTFKLFLPFLIFNFSFLIISHSQSRDQWLKQLTDSTFHGRGYVHNGDKIAADYLEQEFKKLGALPIKKSYRQFYHHDVNTFPDSMRITVNGKTLIPGEDYIIDNRSGTCFEKYENIIKLDLSDYPNYKLINSKINSRSVIVWDFTIEKEGADDVEKGKIRIDAMNGIYAWANTLPVIILQNSKLTWSVGKQLYSFPILYCKKESWTKDSINNVSFGIKNQMIHKYQSSNVYGLIKAKKKWKKKKYLVFSAHFDHLGRMGEKTYFPGANDNASGTTMLLCLMEYYTKNPPVNYNVVFVGFSGEEAGLKGSEYFVKNSPIPLEKIAFVMNMDIMGTGDEGITVVNATKHTKEFELLEKINAEKNYLVKIKKRGETSNSDHYWFDKNGVKSFFIYTMGGIQAYHDVFDKYETLPLTEFEDLKKMLVEFGDSILKN
jgi:aminopeptidase YwaD